MVNVTLQRVQSFVPVSVLDVLVVQRVQEESYSSSFRHADAAAAVVVFTKQESLYFVLDFTGIEASRSVHLWLATSLPVASVVESLRVLVPVRVTAVSNSADTFVATRVMYHPYASDSIQPLAVIGVSPVELSILISSPHCEAREVVVVVQAVQ